MITGRAVSVLLLHHYRRVVVRRAVNHDFAGALGRPPNQYQRDRQRVHVNSILIVCLCRYSTLFA